jgi:hypothetical protein
MVISHFVAAAYDRRWFLFLFLKRRRIQRPKQRKKSNVAHQSWCVI